MIDWHRVAELKSEIGEDDFGDVAELFLSEVEDVLARLRRDPDPNKMEADMHFLKSSALNLGFEALARLCAEREQLAARGDQAFVDIPPVMACYAESKQAFLAEL